ncbi:hypothetical protein [Kribbella soli]|uniref:Uncharacterized protein n=1 Tax=Kribbella soli TaxID=1124743 RepID=A0A4R0HBI1_9ACTN|nr:hypothetical protein [Kribbella soli]TCC08347.1 hypothetical protein E0H45_20895 [Kribbella soli]
MTTRALHFKKAFFDLQAFWVERVVELADVDRLTAWHDWTSTAALVNADGWHAIDEAVHNGDPAAVAHRSWLTLRATLGAAQHGCFWYEVEDEGREIRTSPVPTRSSALASKPRMSATSSQPFR